MTVIPVLVLVVLGAGRQGARDPFDACLASAPYVSLEGQSLGVMAPTTIVFRASRNPSATLRARDVVRRLGGNCRSGKLVDSLGSAIVFIHAPPCQGARPRAEIERQRREQRNALLAKYLTRPGAVVNVASCPGGSPIP